MKIHPHMGARALAIIAALAMLLTGCGAGRLDDARAALRTAHAVLEDTSVALAAAHRSARDRAVAQAPDEAAARAAVAEVHARYLPAWEAYDAARAAWIGAEASVRAAELAELAGRDPDPAVLSSTIQQLAAAYEAFRRAAMELAALPTPGGAR